MASVRARRAAFVSGSKRANKTDWDPAAEDDPDLIPPSPSRVFWYRAWFGAILFLEYAIVRKQVQAYMAFESFRANPRHMRHPWVSIATHVAVDSVALWFMNAFPGSSRCGTRRAEGGEKEKEKEKRILRVPVSVPILARHAAKMCSRVQPVVITLLGASVFHGYTLKQTLLMVLSPTFFNVVGGATGRNALAAMSAVNVAVVLAIVRFNRDAYAGYPDIVHEFQQTLVPDRTFYAAGVSAVATAPFAFAFLTKMKEVKAWGDALRRLHARVYFGGQRALGPETELHASPATIVPLAYRLRAIARRVVPLAVAANALVLAHALFTEPFTKKETRGGGGGGERALAAALASCFLAAAARMTWGAYGTSDTFADEWRELYEDTRNAAERAAFTLAGSYAALSATACAAVTRSEALRAAPGATSRVAAAWLATWCLVAACASAVTPSPAPWRAARAAVLGLAVAAGGLATVDEAAFDAAAAGADAAALAKTLFGAYMCALHAAAAWAAAARGARRVSVVFGLPGVSPTRRENRERKPKLDGHWKPEDFEIDASRFRARARADAVAEIDAQYDYAPTARAQPRGAVEQLAAAARARELAEAKARDSALCAPRCRAEGCDAPVGRSVNALAEGLSLCREHLLAEAPFRCANIGGAAHFCVMCRRVHAPPRCAGGTCGGTEREAYILRRDAKDTSRVPAVAARRGGFRDVSLRAWYKTPEGPVAAAARMRGVVADFASALPDGACALHAEMAVRPGCTLLTVDIGARLREGDGGAGSSRVGDVGPERGDDEVRSRREGSDFVRDFDAARAFTAAGLKRGLDGVVDFVVVDPVSGRSSSRYETESESVRERSRGLAGFCRRLIFDRRAGTAREGDAPGGSRRGFFPSRGDVSQTDAARRRSRFAMFDAFGAFGAFGGESDDSRDAETLRSSEVMRAPMPVLRSDRYDALTLPSPPEGYGYVLQCGGTYVPLLECAAAGGGERAVVAHVTPTNAEGLGFLELVAHSAHSAEEQTATRNDVSPLVSTAVFLTPDPKLAAELARARTGARAEHAPVLFNIGAAITGRASGAAVGAADRNANPKRESAEVREEIVFHAACAAASMGWSEAARRVVDAFDANADQSARGGSSRGTRGYADRYSSMSESPDTATDDFSSEVDYFEIEHAEHEAAATAWCAPPKLGTRAGAATLLRAACSSGDVDTVRLVIAWVIRSFGAVVVSDLLAAGDAIGIGGDWTPLHAAADAVASATAKAPRRGAAAARAAVQALEASADPLSWVAAAPGAARASPSAILRRGGSGLETATRSKALGKQLAAMDEKVLDELASAVARAVAHLRDASGGGRFERFARPEEAPAHFAAAATAAALQYDGSCAHVMAVALLSPGSRRGWDALRARALDAARGDASRDEAKKWLRGGASPAGFPPPTPEEVCAGVYGGKAVAALALLESVVRALHVLFSSNSTRTWSPAAVGILAAAVAAPAAAAAAASRRRAFWKNGGARLAALVAALAAERAFFFISPNASDPGVARGVASLRLALALVASAIAPEKAFWSETSLIAAAAFAAGPGGVFAGIASRRARAAATAAAAAAAAAATRRCVPIVARAHVDKVTAEAMFGTKAKAE